ncbi:hypothetical protein Poli38472_014049 [Pythium oligandrum]|uniref:Chromosome transmission fidelity protein 8 n=1 Tax=Pythium oligandrum TaxID=41045 RepID=A0A8K1FPB0_PYTOL|nr:hypothetical protein Poli38472_014049 [Pythium oligandrum]|eukprot:TMW66737.1 hypothetical protein Poli38472_014049 [Pythium oligandrum]
MLVPLRVDGATNEWCIVEFQGEMVPNDGAEMADVDIGGLWYDGGVPTMRIGNHIVTGKVAKLPKPFAILEKHGETTEPMSDDDGDSSSTETETPVEYNVVGIARTRVIFAARPKPVLT